MSIVGSGANHLEIMRIGFVIAHPLKSITNEKMLPSFKRRAIYLLKSDYRS